MGYFSKELQILDRNTVKYMIDQLQEDNDKLRAHIDKLQVHSNNIQANYNKLQTNNDKLHNENISLRQQHSNDVTQLALLEKYKAIYGELPEE